MDCLGFESATSGFPVEWLTTTLPKGIRGVVCIEILDDEETRGLNVLF